MSTYFSNNFKRYLIKPPKESVNYKRKNTEQLDFLDKELSKLLSVLNDKPFLSLDVLLNFEDCSCGCICPCPSVLGSFGKLTTTPAIILIASAL